MTEGSTAAIATFLNGLLAGIFIGSCLIEHAMRTLNAPDWIAYKQAKEALFGPVMPVVFAVVLIATVVLAFLGPHRVAFATASLLLVAALLITVAVHLPLNRAFGGWSAEAHPPDWSPARRRWRDWNWVRGGLAVLAFAAAEFGTK